MDFNDDVKLMLRYEDIFGQPAKSLEVIIAEMREYSSWAIFYICTQFILLLTSTEGTSPTMQAVLANDLFDQEVKDRLKEFSTKHHDNRFHILHHVPMMMLLKLNLEENNDEGKEIETQDDKMKLVSWFIALSDIWTETASPHKTSKAYFFESNRIQYTRQFLQESHEDLTDLIARSNYLYDELAKIEKLDFNATFKEATGIPLERYMEILLWVAMRWSLRQ